MDKENQFISNDLFSFLTGQTDSSRFSDVMLEKAPHLDWDLIIERLYTEGLASIFYYHINKSCGSLLLPPNSRQILLERFNFNLRRNMAALGRAKTIFHDLRESGIALAVLKGLFLIEHIYRHPAMRGSSDIDLLVHSDDLFRVDTHLRALGYESKDSVPEKAIRNPSGYLASLDYIHGRDTSPHIHIHWHLVNTSVPATMFAHLIPMQRIWDRVMPVKIADTDVSTLCPEHSLIYLCEHALRVGHSFDRLVLVYDIYLFWKTFRDRIDWDLLWNECRIMHLERFIFLALSVVETFTGPVMPEHIRNNFEKHYKLGWGDRIFLAFYRRKIRFRGASYLIYLSLNDTWFDAGRFIVRTLFPPVAILRQRRYIRGAGGKNGNLSLYRQHLSEIFHYLWSLKSFLANIKP